MSSLFQKYGGFTTINVIVKDFYTEVLQSPNLKVYFVNSDMENLIDHQVKFISHLLGGPAEYLGKSLEMSHKHLNIPMQDFLEIAGILQDVLIDNGMKEDDVSKVMTIVASVQKNIVRDEDLA